MDETKETTVTETDAGTEEKETVTMTKEELEKLINSNADRRVSQALKTAEKKQKESEKLKSMSDAERYQYELDEREKKIEEKERALALADMTNTASKILSEKGLSLDLVKFVVNEDGDVTNDNIKLLEKAFKASVKAEVEKRLGQQTPTKNLAPDGSVSREQFLKMTLAERQKLATENPEIYKSLKSK